MGLDMYLTKRVYVGANYAHNNVKGSIDLTKGEDNKLIKIPTDKITYVILAVGYWRKANQIHQWFVDNVQDGVDDCREGYVDPAKLSELRSLCKEALVTRDGSQLPPASGFFFGSTEVDDYYWSELEDTVEMLKDIDDDCEYYYHSSW